MTVKIERIEESSCITVENGGAGMDAEKLRCVFSEEDAQVETATVVWFRPAAFVGRQFLNSASFRHALHPHAVLGWLPQ